MSRRNCSPQSEDKKKKKDDEAARLRKVSLPQRQIIKQRQVKTPQTAPQTQPQPQIKTLVATAPTPLQARRSSVGHTQLAQSSSRKLKAQKESNKDLQQQQPQQQQQQQQPQQPQQQQQKNISSAPRIISKSGTKKDTKPNIIHRGFSASVRHLKSAATAATLVFSRNKAKQLRQKQLQLASEAKTDATSLNSNSNSNLPSTTDSNKAKLKQLHQPQRQPQKQQQQQQHQQQQQQQQQQQPQIIRATAANTKQTAISRSLSASATQSATNITPKSRSSPIASTTRSQLNNANYNSNTNNKADIVSKLGSSSSNTFSPSNSDLSEASLSLYNTQQQTSISIRMVDQTVIDKLEAGYAKLQAATPEQCHSLLKKYLTREVLDKLKTKQTAMGATLLDCCQSGFENLDSGIGVYAPDAESYTLFADLFNPIIEDYHGGFKPTDKHPASDFGNIESFVNVDPNNKYVISTRVRCGRSLQGYPFNPCLKEAQYKEMEDKVSTALKKVEGDLAGTYYPLTGMSKDVQQKLIDDHFLFKEGDRFLQAANANHYWPTGRGIFHNDAKSFLVWVNEEDHLRIISMQMGGDLKTIFGRLVRGVRSIESHVPFSHDSRLGFLTFCPTNLGTTIRASVHIKLPKLAADRKKLEEVAGKFNLQVRGTSGEHTESVGGVYDISNKRRLGLTEYQAVKEMQDGILELIKIEESL